MAPYRENPPLLWPGVLDAVPAEFADCLREPAFSIENATFCIWRRRADETWQRGPIQFPPDHPDPDGSAELLSPLDGMPATYRDWAADYYDWDVPLAAVEHVYRHRLLTARIVAELNPDLTLPDLAADISEIGYPGVKVS